MKTYNNIYILGGHTLAFSYFNKIQQAKNAGLIDFNSCHMIDPNPECAAKQNGTKNLITERYADFILNYFKNNQASASPDTLIPDHTAKHVMFEVYLETVKRYFPNFSTALSPIEKKIETPFIYESPDRSSRAVSYATWSCPADCDEPHLCPHIKKSRSWDFNFSLKEFMDSLKESEMQSGINISINRFECEILIYEIAQIPFSKITKPLENFINDLKTNPPEKVIVATHSHCHGIMGQFALSV